jgi:hypothetical protein
VSRLVGTAVDDGMVVDDGIEYGRVDGADTTARDRAGTRRAASVVVVLHALFVLAIVRGGHWRDLTGALQLTLFDDATISMSYARTAAAGGGPVWYPGAPVVEGITNPGWTAVMAAVHWVGLAGTGAALVIVALGLGVVWATAWCGARLLGAAGLPTRRGARWWAAVAAVVLSFPLLYWTVRGMEVGVVVLASVATLLLTWSLVHRPSAPAGRLVALVLVAALAVAVRQDATVVVVAVSAWALWRGGRPGRRVASVAIASAAAATLALTATRWSIYGELLPNTYHLKVEGIGLRTRLGRGLLVDAITAGPYLVAPLALVAAAWDRLRRTERELVGMVGTVVVALVAYSTYVGGDAWEQFLIPNRYLTPATVLLALAAVGAAIAAWDRAASDGAAASVPFRRRWARAALVVGVSPAVAVVCSLVAGELFTGSGGLTPPVDAALVLPAVLTAVAGAWAAARLTAPPGGPPERAPRPARVGVVWILALLLAVTCVRLPNLARDDGTRFARLGDHLAAVTRPEAVIAAGGVGGVQYWSGRRVLDVLGKSDERIARSTPVGPSFLPGHDKYDAAYTVGELQPDVVAQGLTAAQVQPYGYVAVRSTLGPLPEGIPLDGEVVWFVRPDSTEVRWELLERIG